MRTTSGTAEVTYYLAAARRAPQLDHKTEAELAQRWRLHRDRRAANLLAHSQLRLVVTIAMKYRRSGIPLGELVAEGNVGIVKALQKFEPERGLRFATYANYWVRAQMLACMIRSHCSVGGTDGPLRSQVYFKLRRERMVAANQFGEGDAADERLAKRMGMSVERVRAMNQRLDCRDVSLDVHPMTNTDRFVDRLPAPGNQESELLARETQIHLGLALRVAIAQLDPRELHIVRQRFTADLDTQPSLAELARTFKISRERARQLEARAKRKLRQILSSNPHPVVKEWVESLNDREAS